jgi:hypothetical protein
MSIDTVLDAGIAVLVLSSVFGASQLKKLADKVKRALSDDEERAAKA